MIPLIKKPWKYRRMIFSIFLVFNLCNLHSQENIWDAESSLEYGKYLLQKGDYLAAAHEFQRYVYFHKKEKDVVSLWIRAYANAGKARNALHELNNWNKQIDGSMPQTYLTEKSWLFLKLGRYEEIPDILHKVSDEWKYKDLHLYSSIMLQKNWKLAEEELRNSTIPVEQRLYAIAHNAINDKYKSPALAGVLSAIIPGTGKFYVGRYFDGVISLLFVGVMTYQATRFFQEKGIKSWPAWIYTGLGATYYAAGIYGSVKAAKEYNQKKIQKYVDETNRILYSVY